MIYPDTDPRSWNYIRSYRRPNINFAKTMLFICISFGTATVVALILHEVLALSSGTTILCSLGFLLVNFAIRAKQVVIWLIKCYQRFAPIRVRAMCRFEPSCSEYMILAVEKYGVCKGVQRGINRIYRCSHKDGGFDYP